MYPNTIPHSGRLFLYIYRKRTKKKFLVLSSPPKRLRRYFENCFFSPWICVFGAGRFFMGSVCWGRGRKIRRATSFAQASCLSRKTYLSSRPYKIPHERVEAAPKGIGTASGNKEVEVYIIRRCLQFMMPFPAGFPGSAASCLRRTFPGIFRGSLLGRRVLLYPVHSIFQRRSYISWCIVQVCTCPFTLIERLR